MFTFGNLVGEIGDAARPALAVSANDMARTRRVVFSNAPIGSPFTRFNPSPRSTPHTRFILTLTGVAAHPPAPRTSVDIPGTAPSPSDFPASAPGISHADAYPPAVIGR